MLLCAYAILLCARAPEIIIKGRFWAEEGKVFFKNAWTMMPIEALLTSYAGYLNLAANGAALAARWLVPLEQAPYVTIGVSLVVHLLAPLLLLTARDPWLRSIWTRVGCLLILLLAPQVDEGLLQTLHCQFQLALCCALILALDNADGWRRVLCLACLFLAPLCGLVAIAVLPLFVARSLADWSRQRAMQTLVLSAGATIQLLLFYHSIPGRSGALHPLIALCVVTLRYLDAPFLGLHSAQRLADMLNAILPYRHIPRLVLYLPLLTFGPLLFMTAWRPSARPAFWLLASGGAIAALTFLGAIGGGIALVDALGGERYVFVPQTLFGLTLLNLATAYDGWAGRAAAGLVLWLLTVGAQDYLKPWHVIAAGPSWRAEVALWRADPTHVIQIWPVGWTMTLQK